LINWIPLLNILTVYKVDLQILKFPFDFYIKSFPQNFIKKMKLIKKLQKIKQNFTQKSLLSKASKSLEMFPENKDGKERYVF
jgi:hypothetical protein